MRLLEYNMDYEPFLKSLLAASIFSVKEPMVIAFAFNSDSI